MNDEEILKKINQFTNKPINLEDVYVFNVHLCDNDIDRDLEVFSNSALDTLQKLFIGKTGIFDHKPKATNQVARLFDTEVISDTTKTTIDGRPYKYLKGYAYMMRTPSNEDFIKNIEGGIKKEVSISCSAEKHICSICGTNKYSGMCSHLKGKEYDSKICYTILDDITDAYEWSFVAVPSQVNAGVTKHFKQNEEVIEDTNINFTSLKIARIRTEVLKKRSLNYEY